MKTNLLKRVLMIVGMTVVMCGYALQASAITFNFTQQAGFKVTGTSLGSSDATTPYNDIKWYQAAGPVAPVAGEYNTIAWGVSNDSGGPIANNPWGSNAYSALQVFGQTGPVDANGGWVTLTKLYHQNSAISSVFYTLKNAIINGSLTIVPSDAGFFPNTENTAVTFTETLNAGICDPNGPAGTACPDYFTVNAGTFIPVNFTYGGKTYGIEFTLAPIAFAQIDPVNSNGDIRVWTQENTISEIDVLMRISSVPEPATMLLLGLGLIGIAGVRRKFEV